MESKIKKKKEEEKKIFLSYGKAVTKITTVITYLKINEKIK